MAARPGEENVAILFGDIHYFYGPPTDKPPHHRFDKGSYVYLFEDASRGRTRIEIANNPGTDDQDAFEGFLDSTHLRYSYNQTCVVSLAVGEVQGHEEWHLPTYDPNNQNKYHYKLHSLDIYFWTQKDALQFVNATRRLLPPAQCEVLDEPAPPPAHPADVSAVVQQLERAAISDAGAPSAGSGSSTPSFAPSFAPPPPPPPPPPPAGATDPSPAPPVFAPMAYNPAAPAAPEQVRPREKTPPPDDGGVNPLHQTLAHDATTPFSPGLLPGSAAAAATAAASAGGPLLSPGVPPPQFSQPPGAPSFPAPPQHSVTSPGLAAPQGFGALAPPSYAPAAAHAAPQPHPGLSRAVTMPAGLGVAAATPTPPPPPGGFSQYSYVAGAGGGSTATDYSIHQQLYRPTESEVAKQYQPKKEVRGKLEENAGRLERGVTGMFKKFEKKWG